MDRGDVRWYQFPKPDKRRPIVILTRQSAIEYLNDITIAPITSTIRDIPSEVLLTPADGMQKDCAINLDHIQTVAKSRIGPLIIRLSREKQLKLRSAAMFALGLREIE